MCAAVEKIVIPEQAVKRRVEDGCFLLAICVLATRCHQILHTGPLKQEAPLNEGFYIQTCDVFAQAINNQESGGV